ncbi:hypothetical protein BC940DRAFT_298339 [Gongronella butleri]|nr:hypothetical protein BC940DRAFT_298339 [Gongronella butleri]
MRLDAPHGADQLEMLCGDTVLEPTMTLASIRQHIMKSNGDILLSYRPKTTQPLSVSDP